jgi:hypothetical protein
VQSNEIEKLSPALQTLQIKHCITSGKCDNLNKGICIMRVVWGGETSGRSCGTWRRFQSVHVSNRRHAYCRLALEVGGSRHFTSPLPSIFFSSPFFGNVWPQKLHISCLKNAFVLVTNSIEKGSHPRIMSKSLNSLQLLRLQCASTANQALLPTHACVCLWLPFKVFLWPVGDTVTHQA